MRQTLAIIPARGGSKGIPRKNILQLAGKPMLSWTIDVARASRHVGRIVVSTDDAEIAAVAQRCGAEVVWRPPEISGDAASSESALLHALEHMEQTEGYRPDLLVFLQCTSPLTAPEDVDGTVQALFDAGADTALSVTPCHYFLWKADRSGDAVGINHDKRFRPRRQEREPQYVETGAVYVMRAAAFREHKHRFFGKTALYVQPPERRWEIDDMTDVSVAEVLLREQGRAFRESLLPERPSALVLDFDGVFTDNRVLVFDDGREAVRCSRSDGWGLAELRESGLPIVVISTEMNPVVSARCRKLQIDCIHGVDDKLSALHRWAEERRVALDQAIYVGNDVNDLSCLGAVGCPTVVADAHPRAMGCARLVLSNRGGSGALREISELIQRRMNASGGTNHGK